MIAKILFIRCWLLRHNWFHVLLFGLVDIFFITDGTKFGGQAKWDGLLSEDVWFVSYYFIILHFKGWEWFFATIGWCVLTIWVLIYVALVTGEFECVFNIDIAYDNLIKWLRDLLLFRHIWSFLVWARSQIHRWFPWRIRLKSQKVPLIKNGPIASLLLPKTAIVRNLLTNEIMSGYTRSR